MMQLFNLGETVIDTKSQDAVTVVAIIPQGRDALYDIYVLMDESGNRIYMRDDADLITYNKYYWDELEAKKNG